MSTQPIWDGPVIFMGTPAFAVPTLRTMFEAGWPLGAVVCQPDKPSGRGQKVSAPPVKELALSYGLPVWQPERVKRNDEFLAAVKNLRPALIVVVAYGKILPQELLDVPLHGCLNVHASLLPKYRGAAPIQWSLIRGEQTTGVTLMRMDAGMDTGDMLATAELDIAPDDTAASLALRLSELGASLAAERVPEWMAGRLTSRPQATSDATMAPMLTKETGMLDWRLSARELHNLIRGVTPWPGATTQLLGAPMKVLSSSVLSDVVDQVPGTLLEMTPDGWKVATGDGVLVLNTVQIPGKPPRAAADVARGWRELVQGARLGEPVGAIIGND